ncbi:MAG: hypothetical protein ACREOO_11075 [bacterium]
MVAKPSRIFLGKCEFAQPATGDNADIGGTGKIPRAEGFEAKTPPGHLLRFAVEAQWEILRGGEVRLGGSLVEEKHPASVKAEEFNDFLQRLLQQRTKLYGSVKCPRDVIED